jgi:hypothetical protein
MSDHVQRRPSGADADHVARLLRDLPQSNQAAAHGRSRVIAATELRRRRRTVRRLGWRPLLLAAASLVIGIGVGSRLSGGSSDPEARLGLRAEHYELVAPNRSAPGLAAQPALSASPLATGFPSASPPRPPVTSPRSSSATPGTPAESATPEQWVRWVASGEFARVVNDARSFGEARCLSECPREPLRALAESARYSGQASLAQHALEALRSRFPNTVDAAEAAFLIGRAAERSGQWTEALRNYELYLAEAPNGRFAEDAVGGKLQVLAQRGDPAARNAATQYLERFPQGLHAERARQVLSPP